MLALMLALPETPEMGSFSPAFEERMTKIFLMVTHRYSSVGRRTVRRAALIAAILTLILATSATVIAITVPMQTLGIVENILGREKTESLLTQEEKAAAGETSLENITLEELSTESLSEYFNTLQDSSYPTLEKSDAALSAAEMIGRIIEARFSALDPEEQLHRMSEPITKETLVGFVTMQMEDIRAKYLLKEMEDKTIAMSVEDEEMLKILSAFLSDVEKNATDENVYDYWCRYWEEIRNESLPVYYYQVK